MCQALQFRFKKLNKSLTSVPSPTLSHLSESECHVRKSHNNQGLKTDGSVLINNPAKTTDVNPISEASKTSSSILPRPTRISRQIQSPEHTSNPVCINRLLIGDRRSSLKYLIDTGADVSVIPPTMIERGKSESSGSLFAANGSIIITYGEKRLELNLGLRRSFTWTFIIADVKQPIIGADFIMHYKLLIDLANDRLIDVTTLLATMGSVIRMKLNAIKAYDINKEFDRILEEFPEIVNPNLQKPWKKPKTYHYIETKGLPTFTTSRILSPDILLAAREEFRTMIQQGICRPSKSCWASALHMEPKINGDYQFCGDYRSLNRLTIPDRYPIPFIQDFTANLCGKTVFSKIDLKKAFDQIEIHPDDIPKTAITTPFGLYEFKFMTHVMRNASQTLQRFMHEVTEGLDFVFVNIEDILVFSINPDEHKIHLQELFDRLRAYGLQINPAKCQLGQSQVQYLGHLITEHGIHALADKVSAIKDYELPLQVNQLKNFLETINYYRRFIPCALYNQHILQQLVNGSTTKADQIIHWTKDAKNAFDNCKNDLADNTLLVHQAHDAELSLDIDVSLFAIGAALNQFVGGQKQPLGFFSRKLSRSEMNYSTYDQELLAMYKVVKHFRYMLEGRYFYILTNHEPLVTVFLQKPEKASLRQLRLLDFIGQFTSDIRHIPRKNNVVAEFLSRIQSIKANDEIDFELLVEAQESDRQLQSYLTDKKASSLNMKLLNVPNHSDRIYCDISQETVRPFIPAAFRQNIVARMHGRSHRGTRATIKLITQRYVWPGIRKDCAKFVRTCIPCQRSNIQRHENASLASYKASPKERFEHINIDLVGPLPPSNRYTHVLTCIDRFTQWPEAIPLFDIQEITIAKALAQNWISRFGVPLRITTAQGRQFESKLFGQLNRLLGTNQLRTCSFHPQANGTIENWHRTLKASIMCQNTPNWVDKLPVILLGMRSVILEEFQATPAEMVYGTTLRLPGEFFTESQPCRNEHEFVKEFRIVLQQMAPTNRSNASIEKVFIQKDLATCTHVFIRNDAVRKTLQPPFDGPFKVLKRTERYFTVQLKHRKAQISMDRLKAAFIVDPIAESADNQSTLPVTPKRSKKHVTIIDPARPDRIASRHNRKTRSGR